MSNNSKFNGDVLFLKKKKKLCTFFSVLTVSSIPRCQLFLRTPCYLNITVQHISSRLLCLAYIGKTTWEENIFLFFRQCSYLRETRRCCSALTAVAGNPPYRRMRSEREKWRARRRACCSELTDTTRPLRQRRCHCGTIHNITAKRLYYHREFS